MKIDVTQEHIDSNFKDGLRNPIALALNEQVGNFAFVVTKNRIVATEQKRPYESWNAPMPESLSLWLGYYLEGYQMFPFSFEIEAIRE